MSEREREKERRLLILKEERDESLSPIGGYWAQGGEIGIERVIVTCGRIFDSQGGERERARDR